MFFCYQLKYYYHRLLRLSADRQACFSTIHLLIINALKRYQKERTV
jgi:hypothetical protein